MSPAPTARDPPLVFRGMTCGLDLWTPVVTPIGYPATSMCYPLESSRIAGTQNVATSTPLLMPSRLLQSTSVHCKVNPYTFTWLLNGPEILKFPSESNGTRPDPMDVTHPCRNGLWPVTEYRNGG